MNSIIQAKWKEEQCPNEYGIFFSNDECILLEGEPKDGYTPSIRSSVSSLIESKGDYWIHLYANPDCYIEDNGFIVLGGETSWEADGFIAVLEGTSGNLIWVMHLLESEKFMEVSLDGENILALSAEYPESFSWKIPLNNPQMLEAIS
jgi:hypothetical protein